MDYSRLRKDISSRSGATQTVAVNHRALITRTLTKYPVDYALYRELLQNSADARATSVIISFSSGPSAVPLDTKEHIKSVHTRPITRLTVKNDGALFEKDDWDRLREIAKGNPNESKIGAFGVGFYSVFDLTDEPLVHSGDTAMAFYYEGDQLHYTKDTSLTGDKFSKWTVIDLPYKAPGTVPSLAPFTAFLTQTFVLVPLSSLQLEVDGVSLLSLKKVTSPPTELTIPSHINCVTPSRILRLKKMQSEAFQVAVRFRNVTQSKDTGPSNSIFSFGRKIVSSFLTSSEDPLEFTEVVCFLRKVTGYADVSISSSYASSMKATVMKAPAREAVISMLAHNLQEKELSELKPPLSDYIFPEEFADAKIFIGFPTKQTTSVKAHLCMNQLIPTMERTAADMSNGIVKDWNEQMLYLSGILIRAVYESEMSSINVSLAKDVQKMWQSASYTMNQFESHKSAPDAMVGNWIASGFWKSSKQLSLPSQKGIVSSTTVRVAGEASAFIQDTPILPKTVEDNCAKFIDRCVHVGLLSKISTRDVINEVQGRPLPPAHLKPLLSWCVSGLHQGSMDTRQLADLMGNTVISSAAASSGKFVPSTLMLGSIKYYQNKFSIPEDLPLPESCLPFEYARNIPASDLDALGWTELGVATWLDYLVKDRAKLPVEFNLTVTESFAITVLQTVGHFWSSLNVQERTAIRSLLSSITCIPTQLGMKMPSESYLVEIPLFPHLPVKSSKVTAPYTFLFDIGLRESVDLAFVFEQLHNPTEATLKWSTFDLVKYLTAHRQSLKNSDWQLLSEGAFFEAEPTSNSGASEPKKLYRAYELYAPDRQLSKLGFLVMRWSGDAVWSSTSAEASLLSNLRLRSHPTENELFSMAVKASRAQPKEKPTKIEDSFELTAIDYFLTHFKQNGYASGAVARITEAFIPCQLQGVAGFQAPGSCFIDKEAEMFGFPVVDGLLSKEAWKLGVSQAPSVDQMVASLISVPPTTVATAESKFGYVSQFVDKLSRSSIEACQKAQFIPVISKSSKEATIRLQYPTRVFLEKTEDSDGESKRFFKEFFDFVRLSPKSVPFLLKVGVRYEPSMVEIAEAAVDNPQTMFDMAGSVTEYESFLAELSDNLPALAARNNVKGLAVFERMKKTPFLMAFSYREPSSDDSPLVVRSSLDTASNICIVDNVVLFNMFKKHIKTAPQDNRVEKLYSKLGSPLLSDVIRLSLTMGKPVPMTEEVETKVTAIKRKIIERVKLFLESTREPSKVKVSVLEKIRVVPVTSIQLSRKATLQSAVQVPVVEDYVSAYFNPQDKWVLNVCLDGFDWFDVAQALIREILQKPTPDAVIILEMQLRSDLKSLQRKGYNVERLLKQQRIHAKAEAVEREHIKQEAQKKLLREQDEKVSTTVKEIPTDIPGSSRSELEKHLTTVNQNSLGSKPVDTSRERALSLPAPVALPGRSPPPGHPMPVPGARGIFGSLRTGLQKLQAQNPPGSHGSTGHGHSHGLGGGTPRPVPSPSPTPRPYGEPTKFLENGIKGTRPFQGGNLLSGRHIDIQPPVEAVGCNDEEIQDLKLVMEMANGPRCYVRSSVRGFTEEQLREIERFRSILIVCSRVFGCNWSSFHIFLDETSKTMAFNFRGSLFFNLRYFYASFKGQNRTLMGPWDPVESLNFWFPIVAHELAHNLATSHGAHHSFYTESYIQYYLQHFIEASSILAEATSSH